MANNYYVKTRAKFNNKRTEFNGRKYDSKLEASTAQDIELLRKSGEVIKVEPQYNFPLYGKNGSKICTYRADFLLTFKDGHREVWEPKGIMFPISRLKLLLFVDNYPDIKLTVINSKKWYVYGKQK